jgi:hypothetical protein
MDSVDRDARVIRHGIGQRPDILAFVVDVVLASSLLRNLCGMTITTCGGEGLFRRRLAPSVGVVQRFVAGEYSSADQALAGSLGSSASPRWQRSRCKVFRPLQCHPSSLAISYSRTCCPKFSPWDRTAILEFIKRHTDAREMLCRIATWVRDTPLRRSVTTCSRLMSNRSGSD